MKSAEHPEPLKVRSIFMSDIHLGTRGCQADRLLDFLRHHESDNLFLIGDIVDFWAMSRGIHWTPAQNTVVQKILRAARKGTQVIFVPGNHDEALREYVGITFGDIRLEHDYIHRTADGRRYLLLHGDEYDQVTRYHRWVAVIGDVAYNVLVRINGWLSRARRRLGISGYWSLAGYAKRKVKTAVSFIFDFEDSVIHGARERGVDGVICGHIHWASMREVDGLTYVNCGDWVDSCTAIVEHLDGRLELIEWRGHRSDALRAGRPAAPPTEIPELAENALAAIPDSPTLSAAIPQFLLRRPDAGNSGR
ncbi:UDP-2,3-diacylglucosamine diphosphatase [Pseudothauera rhizosphaerae]|uniref:UDP-2,3-diacylglucosamine diphosphatase n=1 Tax=Pseudothauera rhizosphaerae TaxID=2565932 RepID=A0A4V3WA71_9RHOO|nr:UDP-2,3-diacylglucosamine diphosphatase [Pseudothauera rhizosphaerae]THF58080.1 UDP-2,3-diacylglucosamine diphosphatase [Pseudothauera rhizosphaerae]